MVFLTSKMRRSPKIKQAEASDAGTADAAETYEAEKK